MITTFLASTPDQFDTLFSLTQQETSSYLDDSLRLMGMSVSEFRQLFSSRGQVTVVKWNEDLAGYYWTELREDTLHLHGLILKPEFQGKGIGTHILRRLEQDYRGRANKIELGVHESNVGAIRLYQKLGYETVRSRDDLGYLIMQHTIQPE